MRETADQTALAGRAGWTLVQLSELVRRAEQLLLDGVTLVGPHAHAAMAPGTTIELGSRELERIVRALGEGAEIAEQLEMLAARLPADGIVASYDAVRAAAAADVANGIVDPRRLLLAARVLDVEHGWPALADSLAAGDVVSAWATLTVGELLGRFRGADRALVARVADEAGLAPTGRLASCTGEQLAALAQALQRYATAEPTP